MASIASVGLGIPTYEVTQNEVKAMLQKLFKNNRRLNKLLPVFDNAMVESRQLAKPKQWYEHPHSFKEKNAAYIESVKALSLEAVDQCLAEAGGGEPFRYDAVDAVIFVSSTGIATPSLDAYLMNERDFREDIVRMPLWGLGCAGGAMGLSRGFEWLEANPDKTVLVVTCELCSLTFQKEDEKMSNLVGTALFGDGAAAALLMGEESPYQAQLESSKPVIRQTSSRLKKNSLDMMGWEIEEGGLEVVFSKSIPNLIPDFWKQHVTDFLSNQQLPLEKIDMFLAHPGGRKVLEAMEESLHINTSLLRYSYDALRNHGNMSSATVLYILKKWLDQGSHPGSEKEIALLCALGPGFSSELLLVERDCE